MCRRALIVVLGDLGRSPRMINHARALLERGWSVTLAGYLHHPIPPEVAAHPRVGMAPLRPGPAALLQLAWLAGYKPWTAIIVQNPPGFPALAAVALTVGAGTRLVLDWHNLGGTLLALRPSTRRRWAWLYAACERAGGRLADDHWAVSGSLAAVLEAGSPVVIYDQPAGSFCAAAVPTEDRLTWWRRTLPGQPFPLAPFWVAAPSSWGPDEDQAALLRVARSWREQERAGTGAPAVAVIATGRGPGQPEFASAAAALAAGPMAVQTAWLPPEAYPAFLALADLGVCLHSSSSGRDLPMKLADFRGARLPALVFDYGPVLEEVLAGDPMATRFRGDAELAQALRDRARAPAPPPRFAGTPLTWEEEWNRKLGGWANAQEIERPAI